MKTFFQICVLCIVVPVAVGCKARNSGSEIKSESSTSMADFETSSPIGGNPFLEGFSLRTKVPEAGEEWSSQTFPMVVYNSKGASFADNMSQQTLSDGAFALDRGLTPEGEVIFTWPKASERINRDYDRLSELMVEYSKLVGTCLSRQAEGKGETAWLQWLRTEQHQKANRALSRGSEAYCAEVVNQLVDRFVPQGSTYRQYGNCGEGGRIGACLAKRAGFRDDEIRLCLSQNDHFFGMVREEGTDASRRWCILDRWDLIGHFGCNVDVNTSTQVVTKNGRDVTDQKWFQKVKCATLDQWVKNPRVLY